MLNSNATHLEMALWNIKTDVEVQISLEKDPLVKKRLLKLVKALEKAYPHTLWLSSYTSFENVSQKLLKKP